MIKKISTKYVREDPIDFIIDDDEEMLWLSSFDSSKYERFFVVIDKEVNRVWGDVLRKRINHHNKEVFFFEIEVSEESKSIESYQKVISFFEKHRCNLFDLVFAVGGGILLDLVSFSCSTYMRNLPFIAIPTTLIGQVDASTAGKTCLNTSQNRNILGTFYYPLKVYNNVNFLKTNSQYYLRQGYSEVFKYALLESSELIDILSKYMKEQSKETLMEIIRLTIEIRIKIRKKNPLASNLGHTFGQSMEKMFDHKILHGDAISSGIVMALYFAEKKGLISREVNEQIIKKMKELGLNIYIDKKLDLGELVDAMKRDKKSSSKYLNLVLITDIGKPYEKEGFPFYKTDGDEIKQFLEEFFEKYPYKVENLPEFICKERIDYDKGYDEK